MPTEVRIATGARHGNSWDWRRGQEGQVKVAAGAQARFATFNPNQAVSLQQVDRRRRCDGDGDRDDRGCYYVYTTPSRGYAYYGNGYYAGPVPSPYYHPDRGWYDNHGRWHAYDRDRDRDRRRHHDDDRR